MVSSLQMRLCPRVAAWIFCALLALGSAEAAAVWQWSYSGDGVAASGTFLTEDKPGAGGGYLIMAVTGTRNGERITALQKTGTSIPGNEPYTVDNLIFKGPGPQLTSHGFGFETADGNFSNPFYADFLPAPGYLEFFSMPDKHSSTELPVNFTATLVATPEPSAFGLVVSAALFTFSGWRKRKPEKCPAGTPST